jgi:hypothetical protein
MPPKALSIMQACERLTQEKSLHISVNRCCIAKFDRVGGVLAKLLDSRWPRGNESLGQSALRRASDLLFRDRYLEIS